MKRVIREKRLSVSENSPTRSAPSVAIISVSTALVLLGARLGDAALGERQTHALDEVAVAVERLVEVDPPLGPAPVGAREDLEARDVATAPAQPAALLADADPQVDVLAHDVHPLDVQRVEALARASRRSPTSRQRAIGSSASRKQAWTICSQYSCSLIPASAAIAGVP